MIESAYGFGDAHELIERLMDALPSGTVVYVEDFAGREFTWFQLRSRTLTDGSVVYTIVLGVEADR